MEKRRPELEFTTNKKEMLKILFHSKKAGTVVGISSPSLGAGVFLTSVEDIVSDYETIVTLKPFDVNGNFLAHDKLKLTEIHSVCAFHARYENIYRSLPEKNVEANFYSY